LKNDLSKNVSTFGIPKCDTHEKPYQVLEFRNVVQISKKYKNVSGFGISKCDTHKNPYQVSEFRNVIQISKNTKVYQIA